eukprot:sb/3478317/
MVISQSGTKTCAIMSSVLCTLALQYASRMSPNLVLTLTKNPWPTFFANRLLIFDSINRVRIQRTDQNKSTTNQNSLIRSREWLSANQVPVFPNSVGNYFLQ